MTDLKEEYPMPEGVQSWYTDFIPKTTEWVHAIISDSIDIKFRVNVRHTPEPEFIEFMEKYLVNVVDKDIRDKIFINFKATKEILEKKADQPSFLANLLPGVDQEVTNPVTGSTGRLFDVIINLNDNQKWTREQVADWIDTLPEVPVFELESDDPSTITILEHKVKTSK